MRSTSRNCERRTENFEAVCCKKKSFAFAIEVVKLYQYLARDKKEYILSKQFLSSGTSVGAMIIEAEHAETKRDFIHKMAIAQKEINECMYWLELLKATAYLEPSKFDNLYFIAVEIMKLITSIIRTAKANINHLSSAETIN